MFFVYVLKSLKTDFLYKGMTDNVERRFKEHCNGNSKTTKGYLSLELVFVQVCDTRIEARKLEKYLKSGYGR